MGPLRVWRFRAMWIASLFSNIGSFFYTVAASWLMLEMTGSASWVGLMQASNSLPLLFVGLAAGAMVDMFGRTRVMLLSQSLMGVASLVMAAVTWAGYINAPLLLFLGLVIGLGVAFNLPAWQALVPNLVPRELLAPAVALNSAGFNVARSIGPALAGAVVASAGAAVAFGLNAVSFLGVIVVIVWVGRDLEMPTPESTSLSSAIGSSVRFARFTPAFRRLLVLLALFALTSAVVQSVLPSRTVEIGGRAGTYGFLLGAMGVGALVAALSHGKVVGRLRRRSLTVTVSLFGSAGIVAGVTDQMWVVVMALAVTGACWVLSLVTLNTTAQTLAPDWVRGRAMSLYTLAFSGVFPLGAIMAGVLADAVGAGNAMIILSVGTLALGMAAPLFRIPHFAELVTPEFTEVHDLADHPEHLDGGPVMVVSTFTINEDDYDEFIEVMSRIRLVRLSTGAYRWRLYRNVARPDRFTEVFMNHSWEDHLSQHRHIDDASRRLIHRARALDRTGGPVSSHLLALDVAHPPNWEEMLATHAELHRTDGSIPLDTSGTAGGVNS